MVGIISEELAITTNGALSCRCNTPYHRNPLLGGVPVGRGG
jgi:hypothetical protein